MGKAARAKQQRRVAPPPPVGKQSARDQNRKTVIVATAGLVAAVAVIAIVLLVTRSSPSVPKAAPETASDKNASASLIAAADAVNFHPTTEAGVGVIENKSADSAPPIDPTLLPVGSVAPTFTLKTPEGKSYSLSQYRGKTVLLEFFATWCPHCNAEAPHLRKIALSFAKNTGLAFLSVNADGETAPSIYAFHRYYGLPYPALVDSSSQPGSFNAPGAPGPVSTKYKVESYPTFYLVGPTGKIVWRNDGEQPDALMRELLTKYAARA